MALQRLSVGWGNFRARFVLLVQRLGTKRLSAKRAISDTLQAGREAAKMGFYRVTGSQDIVALRRNLIEFYDLFEQFVDVACAAARTDVTQGLARDYDEFRARAQNLYPPLRSYLLAYLRVDVSDSAFGLAVCGRATDAFECLFCAPSLPALLSADDGNMMDRIERVRDALYRFGDHLRSKVR
jgi:hypothetical protein